MSPTITCVHSLHVEWHRHVKCVVCESSKRRVANIVRHHGTTSQLAFGNLVVDVLIIISWWSLTTTDVSSWCFVRLLWRFCPPSKKPCLREKCAKYTVFYSVFSHFAWHVHAQILTFSVKSVQKRQTVIQRYRSFLFASSCFRKLLLRNGGSTS